MFLSLYIVFIFLISTYHCKLPEKVLCVNEECNKPISKAITLLNYNSPEPEFISFKANSNALIFMKSVESKPDIWFANINGQNGFVNPRFLKELRILEKTPRIVIDNPIDVINKKQDVQPNKVQKPHEVFEGTTIFTTESSILSNTEYPDDLPVNEQSKTPLADNLETILNHKNLEPDLTSDQLSKDASINTTVEKTITNESVNNDQDVGNNEKNINDSENVSMETNTEPEKSNLIDQKLSESPNNIIDQTLVLQTNTDTSLNMVPTKPPVVNGNEENIINVINSEAEIQSEVDNSNTSNTNGDKNMEKKNSEDQSNIDESQLKVSESAPEDASAKNIVPPSDVNPDKIQTVPDTMPVATVPLVPAVTNHNTLMSTDNVPNTEHIQNNNILPENPLPIEPVPVNVTPMSEPEPIVTETPIDPKVPDNIIETVKAVPVVVNTIPVQFDNAAPSIPPMENKPPENIPTIPEVPIAQPFISKPDYRSEDIPNPQYTTETIAAIETSTESYVSNDDINSKESETPTIIQENMPSTTTTSDASDLSSQSTENLINDIFTESTTQSPVEDTSQGFFSNIYTTIADIMPPSTEQPPPDNIFNPDYVQKTENEPEETDSFSFINYLWATYTSLMGAKDESSALFPVVGETCYTDEYCDGTGNNHNRFLTFLLTTASTILLFTLGYYYIDNKRQDSRLIGNINNLQRELLFATKECEILKEELSTTKTKLAGIEDNSFGMDDMVQSLKEEINDLKEQNERLKNSLDDNEKLLRVSENTASELQNTLGEVENTLSELMEERSNSEEQITELNEKIRAFEEELISVSRDRDNFQLKYVSAENALEEFNKQKQILEELNKKFVEANNTIELQRHEIVALKDTIKELKTGSSSGVDVNSLIDHTEIKAKLAKALEEKNSYMSKYELAHKEQTRLAEELKAMQESYQTASQQATESITRLEVLGKYFQERESELMKELSTKESLYLSKRGESASTVEKMELLQQEIQRYKEKCDALTLSLAEQESAKRATVSELEARAHQAWLEARAARRDADAAATDAAALRRKLVAVSHADGAVSPHRHVASPLEAEGAPVPPLPLAFFPPPFLPPLARPPPLGRLPSPPLPPRFGERRFSPDSRYSPETRYSPESRYSPQSRYSPDRGRYSPDRARHSPDRARHSPDRARHSPDRARHSPDRARYSPERRYSPRRRSPYSSRSRRRSIDRYSERESRRNGDTETEYNSDSPSRRPRRRYSRRSDSSGSGCSSESEK